jgi:hypothetical protein
MDSEERNEFVQDQVQQMFEEYPIAAPQAK